VGWKEALNKRGKLAEVKDERSRAFDIAYAEDRAYLIKIVHNIESLSKEKAELLKKCASVVGAEPIVISERGKDSLKEKVIYNRHGINVIHHTTFVNILNGQPVSVADRGGIKVPIMNLKNAREKIKMTRATLSKLLGISTEMVRKYEHGADPSENVAKRLLEIFGQKIRRCPHTEIIKLEKAFIGKAPFDLAYQKKNKSVLVSFSSKENRVKNLENVSDVLDAEAVIIKKLDDLDL